MQEHISTLAHRIAVENSRHQLSEHGRQVLQAWTKSLLESGFMITFPEAAVVEVVSELSILSTRGDDASITWTARISGAADAITQLEESHFSSSPRDIGEGVFEIDLKTTTLKYGSDNAVLNLIELSE